MARVSFVEDKKREGALKRFDAIVIPKSRSKDIWAGKNPVLGGDIPEHAKHAQKKSIQIAKNGLTFQYMLEVQFLRCTEGN